MEAEIAPVQAPWRIRRCSRRWLGTHGDDETNREPQESLPPNPARANRRKPQTHFASRHAHCGGCACCRPGDRVRARPLAACCWSRRDGTGFAVAMLMVGLTCRRRNLSRRCSWPTKTCFRSAANIFQSQPTLEFSKRRRLRGQGQSDPPRQTSCRAPRNSASSNRVGTAVLGWIWAGQSSTRLRNSKKCPRGTLCTYTLIA